MTTATRLDQTRVARAGVSASRHPSPGTSIVRVVEGHIAKANGLSNGAPDSRPSGVTSLYTVDARAAVAGVAAFARANGGDNGAKWAAWLETLLKSDLDEDAELRARVDSAEAEAQRRREADRERLTAEAAERDERARAAKKKRDERKQAKDDALDDERARKRVENATPKPAEADDSEPEEEGASS